MTNEHENEHPELFEHEWMAGNNVNSLKEQGAASFYSKENMPDIDRAFSKNKDTVVCMDEGCACMKFEEDESVMGFAGSGILYPAKNWQERVERVAELLHQKGLKTITSHDGCGAAGIAYKRDGGKEGTGFDSSDEYGKKWSKDLTQVLRSLCDKGENIGYRHIDSKEMVRPESFHNARAVYLDATGEFNPGRLEKTPQRFLS